MCWPVTVLMSASANLLSAGRLVQSLLHVSVFICYGLSIWFMYWGFLVNQVDMTIRLFTGEEIWIVDCEGIPDFYSCLCLELDRIMDLDLDIVNFDLCPDYIGQELCPNILWLHNCCFFYTQLIQTKTKKLCVNTDLHLLIFTNLFTTPSLWPTYLAPPPSLLICWSPLSFPLTCWPS